MVFETNGSQTNIPDDFMVVQEKVHFRFRIKKTLTDIIVEKRPNILNSLNFPVGLTLP